MPGVDFNRSPFWPLGQYGSLVTISKALTGYAKVTGFAQYADDIWIDREVTSAERNARRRESYDVAAKLGVRPIMPGNCRRVQSGETA